MRARHTIHHASASRNGATEVDDGKALVQLVAPIHLGVHKWIGRHLFVFSCQTSYAKKHRVHWWVYWGILIQKPKYFQLAGRWFDAAPGINARRSLSHRKLSAPGHARI